MWGRLACSGIVATILIGGIPLPLALATAPPAALANRGPILIDGNAAFTAANGVAGGSGTASDPYAIEGWEISAAASDAISIRNTDAHFVLRNLSVHSDGYSYAGIRLYQVTNGYLENNLVYDCAPALVIDLSTNVTVADNSFTTNYASAWVSSSTGLTFTRNRFRSGGGMEFTESQWVNVTENTATDPQFWVRTSPYGSGAHYNVSGNTISGIFTTAFVLDGIDGVVIEGNRLGGPAATIGVVRSTNVRVYQNVYNGLTDGIAVVDSHNVAVERNSVSSNLITGQGQGIRIEHSSNVLVAQNILTNNTQGIALVRNMNVTAATNQLVGSGFWIDADTIEEYRSVNATDNTVNEMPFVAYRGCNNLEYDRAPIAQIFLVDCRNITIRNQTFADLETGAELINVEDAMVESSVFQNLSSDAALRVVWGSNITIERSNFTRNMGYGIWASYAENLRVVENTMRENYIGMVIRNTTNAWINHNNFIHSGLRPEEALDFGTVGTRWDAGYPDGGNYWSYSYGTDQCSGAQQDICGPPDGIKDTPVTVVPDGVDRYPLLKPRGLPSLRPVAHIDAPDAPSFQLTVTQSMSFNAWRSSDPDGLIVAYEWEFGDGTRATGDYVVHTWLSGGLFNMTLTVRDNANEVNSTTVRVDVSVPMPVAVLRVQPSGPIYASQRLTFDGGQSRSGWDGGDIASWDWDFGDGTRATGVVVTHAFSTPGTYATRLTVTNQFGRTAIASLDLAVIAIPDITLHMYENSEGFRIPIPSGWSLTENVRLDGGTPFAAVLGGPEHDRVPTTILIATAHEPSARETDAYLRGFVDGALAGVQQESPGSVLSEGPSIRAIGGHAGVVFAVMEPGPPPLVDKLALVVSDDHDRVWFFVIIAHADFFLLYNATFNQMVDGFEVTLPSPAGVLLTVSAIALVIGVVAVVIIVLVLRQRKAKGRSLPPGLSVHAAETRESGNNGYCPACGTRASGTGGFCGSCGTPLTPPETPGRP